MNREEITEKKDISLYGSKYFQYWKIAIGCNYVSNKNGRIFTKGEVWRKNIDHFNIIPIANIRAFLLTNYSLIDRPKERF